MENSSTILVSPDSGHEGGDGLSVWRWFAGYGILVAAAAATLAVLDVRLLSWSAWSHHGLETFTQAPAGVKLLVLGVYLSVCCTFLPLPTGWLVAAVATRQAAVADSVWATTFLVAVAGGVGSTIANLHDYHLLTWMLRHRHIAKVRLTKTYRVSAGWFARSPFLILTVFNVLTIPVDVVRLLATTCRYPRKRFAAASFVGRFLRYGCIAFVTFWWNLGWVAVVTLLGLAFVLGATTGLIALLRRKLPAGGPGLLAGDEENKETL